MLKEERGVFDIYKEFKRPSRIEWKNKLSKLYVMEYKNQEQDGKRR